MESVRAEFDAVRVGHEGDLDQVLNKLVNLDSIQDLEYQNLMIQEALRIQSPGQVTSQMEALEDFTAGNLKLKKGTQFMIWMHGMHYNSKEWQRPFEFLPERFNPKSPLYLTLDGKKRNPSSWSPFSGGKRVCFGKTFAEANLKFMSTYLSQFFDFEFVEPEKYKDCFPYAIAFQPVTRPIKVRVSRRGAKK